MDGIMAMEGEGPTAGEVYAAQTVWERKKQNYGVLVKLINFMRARPRINRKICKGCNICVESCPVQAIDKQSKETTIKPVLNVCAAVSCACTGR